MDERNVIDPSKLGTLEQLMLLKRMTQWTGQLYEPQIRQVHNWLALLFEHVPEFEVNFDAPSRIIVISGRSADWNNVPPNLLERIKHFRVWMGQLLGDDYSVQLSELVPPAQFSATKKVSRGNRTKQNNRRSKQRRKKRSR